MFRRVLIAAGIFALVVGGGSAALASGTASQHAARYKTVTAKPLVIQPDTSAGETIPCPAGYTAISAGITALIADVPQFLPVGSTPEGQSWQVQAVNPASSSAAATVKVTVVCGR